MLIDMWKHEGVNKNGQCASGGAVTTTLNVVLSQPNGGCDLPGCNCSEGHWLCISLPRSSNGVVSGVTIKCDNKIQLIQLLEMLQTAASNYGVAKKFLTRHKGRG